MLIVDLVYEVFQTRPPEALISNKQLWRIWGLYKLPYHLLPEEKQNDDRFFKEYLEKIRSNPRDQQQGEIVIKILDREEVFTFKKSRIELVSRKNGILDG